MIYGPSKGADLIEQSTYIYTPDMDTPPPQFTYFFFFRTGTFKSPEKKDENPGIEIENFF